MPLKSGNKKRLQNFDKRFLDKAWEENPFLSLTKECHFFLKEETNNLIESYGLDKKEKHQIQFIANSLLDAICPANFPFLNPTVLNQTIKEGGKNLQRGFEFCLNKIQTGESPFDFSDREAFELGEEVASTEGWIVFENELFQLICYLPRTQKQGERALLIVPPWINKYYIFDIDNEKSFVKWNLEEERHVFVISWVNADISYASVSFETYVIDGIKKAVSFIKEMTGEKVNVAGFCVGGVALLSGVCSKHIDENDVESLTLLATPIDFQRLSDITLFTGEDSMPSLNKIFEKYGVMPGYLMTEMFNCLRANDLVWSNMIKVHFLGKKPDKNSFLFWNADSSNLPAKMHREYLEVFFHRNEFINKNEFSIRGNKLCISNVKIPVFIVAAERDHIVPWNAAFALVETLPKSTFVLAESGHVAGIINPPKQKKYGFWRNRKNYKTAKEWKENAEKHDYSWWIYWSEWMKKYDGKRKEAFRLKKDLCIEKAPGRYALDKVPLKKNTSVL